MRDKGVEKNLTDEQQKTMQRMISFCIQDDYEKKLYTWASGTLLNDYNGSLDLVGNNIGINFLKQNFDTFDQATKESFIWEAITQSELQENYYSLENDIRRYPNWNYPEKPKKDSFQGFPQLYTMAAKSVDHGNNGQKFLFSSNNSVYPLVKQTLEDSTNEEFIFDVALILAERHDTQIIPKKHYELLKNPQKIEQFVTPEKLKKF
ncbi:MAG: hypothetical protein LBD11_06980 [Candidatus Peribacteria bacterium]|jgi:hypothetical protein|nr:hypothetical protein [Candidatus Peribacteria bacterium]